MNYIIYYDDNYRKYVEYEIGKFVELSNGVGLYSGESVIEDKKKSNIVDKEKLSSGFNNILQLMQVDTSNLTLSQLLDKSIFVRFYHKIDYVCNDIDYNVLMSILSKYTSKVVSVRVVYGKESKYKGITQTIADYLINFGYTIDVKSPNVVISIYAEDRLYMSIDLANELSSNYRAGEPHYHKEEEISRAEFKLLEAIERFKIDTKGIHNAIDLGASPGGWTHCLAKLGIFVTAVDPAQLDNKVLKMSNVEHIRQLAQDYLKNNNNRYDMIVNDMKMFGDKSAHIVCNCAGSLNNGAKVVMTIKLAEINLYEQIVRAITILSSKFNILNIKKLFHTRQEVIVYGCLKNTK